MDTFLSLAIKEYFLMLYLNDLCIFSALFSDLRCFVRSLTVEVSLFTRNGS